MGGLPPYGCFMYAVGIPPESSVRLLKQLIKVRHIAELQHFTDIRNPHLRMNQQ